MVYREKFKFTDLKEHLTDKELILVKTLKWSTHKRIMGEIESE
jgi:hypothetical protein